MSGTAKRKQRVAPPAGTGQWEVRHATSEAIKGWEDLCRQAPANTRRAWEQMCNNPAPNPPSPRHHRLKGRLGTDEFEGRPYPQWQIEVTGGGRIWYLLDEERATAWIKLASIQHPGATE